MEPITRQEKYLAKICGDYSGTVPDPVTRLDYYMAYAAGNGDVVLPTPITRLEYYWAYICGVTEFGLPEPVTRVEKYLGAICGGMILLPEAITREEIYLAKIARQSESLVKSAASKTIVLSDSLYAPFENFRLYGYTTQEGTPTPETPVKLVSAGDSGEINVDVMGGNLLDVSLHNDTSFNGIIGEKTTDGGYHVQGTAMSFFVGDNVEINLPRGFYTINTINGNNKVRFICKIIRNGSINYYYNSTFEVRDGDETMVYVQVDQGETVDVTLYPMLNVSSVALPYEYHKPKQTLAISTPNGLPGIPVSSDGNYTDENGQQWICDEIDFGRGVYVQRVKVFLVDEETEIGSMNPYSTENLGVVQPFRTDEYSGQIIKNSPMICNKLKNIESWNQSRECCFAVEESIDFNILNERLGTNEQTTAAESVEALKEWLKDNPLKFLCCLKNPIEHPISADELAAYRELHTNYPTTTVLNDADAWMKVEYKAKPASKYSEAMTLEWLKGK